MKSVVSYPSRGKFGSSSYRGNTSGYLLLDLINQFIATNKQRKNIILDINEGSGTTGDVVDFLNSEFGTEYLEYFGFDLKDGFDFLKTNYVELMNNQRADLSFSHFPYHDMIHYSGEVWGEISEDDTSHCSSVDEFLEKSYLALMNQRESTNQNGIYTTLIGDMKRQGQCFSFQSDFIKFMPRDELVNVVIKQQHNMQSNCKNYKQNFIPIEHEYLLIWKRKAKLLADIAFLQAKELRNDISKTWRIYIRMVMIKLKKAKLSDIYKEVFKIIPKSLIESNKNIEAKIRQQLQLHYTNVERGVWAC